MPKQRITKEMVTEAAFELARTGGMEQVLVKAIADKLGCSVQPIYSYYKNMRELRQAVSDRASAFIRKYLAAHIDRADIFRSTGYAYVGLAADEPHLFQLFILQKRENLTSLRDLYLREATPGAAESIAGQLDINLEAARNLHLNMMIYTVGIGTILASADAGFPEEEISGCLESAFRAFCGQINR